MQKPGYPRSPRLGRADALSGDSELRDAQQRLREHLRADPGIEAVSFATRIPLSTSFSDGFVRAEGRPTARPDGLAHSWMLWVAFDYFDTLGTRLRKGRYASPADAYGEAHAVLVTLRLRASTSAATAPLGVRIQTDESDVTRHHSIVGVVEDMRQFGIEHAQTPAVHLSLEAVPRRNLYILLRHRGDEAAGFATLRAAVHQLDPSLALSDLRSIEQRVDAALSITPLQTRLTEPCLAEEDRRWDTPKPSASARGKSRRRGRKKQDELGRPGVPGGRQTAHPGNRYLSDLRAHLRSAINGAAPPPARTHARCHTNSEPQPALR